MSSSNDLTIASLQMVSSPDVDQNLQTAERLINEASKQGAQLAVLPEYFCLLGHSDKDKLTIQEPIGAGKLQDNLARFAKQANIYLVAGTVPITSSSANRVLNTSLVFSPLGEVVSRYDKIHLFAFKTDKESYDESEVLDAGSTPTTFTINHKGVDWKFGLSICYDIRFPELYRHMGEVDCHILPAAFTYTTGKAHWEILIRARAIENQCYFLASAQGGKHENGRSTWGHSMIVNPWGEINQVIPEGVGLVVSTLSKELINDVRSKLPALKHRKQ